MDAAQPARLGPAGPPVLTARKLRVVYGDRRELRRGAGLVAVDDVSFDIAPGESVAVVGESGCGKSSLARTLAGLQAPRVGSLLVGGEQVGSPRAWRRKRRAVQMVFQDPASSLDPRMRVEQLLDEPLRALRPDLDRRQRHTRIHAMLEQVGLQPEHGQRYPHSFSGGQAQRIAIARALVVEPDLLICDEPLSALDVSVQARLLDMLRTLVRELGLSVILVTHDLAVARLLAHRLMVMRRGQVVETGLTDQILDDPQHAYTQLLVSSVLTP